MNYGKESSTIPILDACTRCKKLRSKIRRLHVKNRNLNAEKEYLVTALQLVSRQRDINDIISEIALRQRDYFSRRCENMSEEITAAQEESYSLQEECRILRSKLISKKRLCA